MRCKCGHAQEDHERDGDPEDPTYGTCTECEECQGFEAADEGEAEASTESLATETPPVAQAESAPGSPVEYTVLVELYRKDPATEPRRLVKFPGFQQALSSPLVPTSSRIWVSRATFLANADPLEYEDLVDFHDAAQRAVSDDVVEARMTLKSRMFDCLLAIAWTPEQAAQELGVHAKKEGKVPRKSKKEASAESTSNGTKRSYSKLDPDTKIEKIAEKNPARDGSETFARFALIKNNMKVSAYVAAGGKATYLTYFAKGGHIRLVPPA